MIKVKSLLQVNSFLKVAPWYEIRFSDYAFTYLFKERTKKSLKMIKQLLKYLSPLEKTLGLKFFITYGSFMSH